MDKYKETFKTWNKVAALYEDKFMGLDLYNDTYDVFCKLVKNNATILEVGCGPGNITKYITTKRPDLQVIGIDIAPNMIILAKKNNPSVNFKVMDGREINKLQVKFDAIICGFYLPYLSENDSTYLLKNCNELLTKKGVLYLSFVVGDSNKSGFKTGANGDKMYFNYHNLKNIENELIKNNFKITNTIKKHYPINDTTFEEHTILITQKNIK